MTNQKIFGDAMPAVVAITGSGEIRGASKSRSYRPVVAGTVSGEKSMLDVRNSNSGNNVKLDLVRDGGIMEVNRKGEEVIYRKLE